MNDNLNADLSENEISSLITLLEDPDQEVYNHVSNVIKSRGYVMMQHLERYWEFNDFGPLFQNRIEDLIHTIQYDSIVLKLEDWKTSQDKDLLEASLLINKYQYPSFDEDEVKREVAKIRQDIWLELNDGLTAFEIVNVMNQIIFNVHGFQGNKKDYSAPQNSYLSDVLSTKKGNPLSLAVLYQILAQSLDIPIRGVNLPNHFILCYLDENRIGMSMDDNAEDNGILFYINPFSNGTIIHKNEIDEFLFHLDLPREVKYYRPCNNDLIIKRMINNLVFAYIQQGNDDKVNELKALHTLFA